jgi:hypothetical protein
MGSDHRCRNPPAYQKVNERDQPLEPTGRHVMIHPYTMAALAEEHRSSLLSEAREHRRRCRQSPSQRRWTGSVRRWLVGERIAYANPAAELRDPSLQAWVDAIPDTAFLRIPPQRTAATRPTSATSRSLRARATRPSAG